MQTCKVDEMCHCHIESCQTWIAIVGEGFIGFGIGNLGPQMIWNKECGLQNIWNWELEKYLESGIQSSKIYIFIEKEHDLDKNHNLFSLLTLLLYIFCMC